MARWMPPLSQWLGCRCLGFGYRTEIGKQRNIHARDGISDMDMIAIYNDTEFKLSKNNAHISPARTLHPDVAANGQKQDTTYEFIKVQEACETLSDPKKHIDCDCLLFRYGRQMSSQSVMSAATILPGTMISPCSPPPSRVSFRPCRVSAACASTAERPTSYIATPTSASSLYEVLGIQMGATCQEIKTAYRKLARILHPDVSANGQREGAACEFIRLHEAYETLSDPAKRADYDRSLYRRGRQMSSPFSMSAATATTMATGYAAGGFSGYTRRRWETDQCW
ncbi:unnamed protein product [Dovyalis caffra]|uniref:J domain-containing protein n=1 Tax=Dovyalis caffra TaxID=77055 RepID=A0AAV1S8D0_9ROSI|nr:unnamed protein product [Dovyalis caffra]